MSDFQKRLDAMRLTPLDDAARFHAITLTADPQGHVSLGMDTHWVDFQDAAKRIELRASRVVAARYRFLWQARGRDYVFVMDDNDLPIFLLCGGHGLVERSVAERAFGELLGPRPVYPRGPTGFIAADVLPKAALNKAPSPKLRMQVLQRDGRRCRICGQRPDDDANVVLHVHHIRPWAIGGITDAANLITLCHTCHSGLDPHFDPGLYSYTKLEDEIPDYLIAHNFSVANYRRLSWLGASASDEQDSV